MSVTAPRPARGSAFPQTGGPGRRPRSSASVASSPPSPVGPGLGEDEKTSDARRVRPDGYVTPCFAQVFLPHHGYCDESPERRWWASDSSPPRHSTMGLCSATRARREPGEAFPEFDFCPFSGSSDLKSWENEGGWSYATALSALGVEKVVDASLHRCTGLRAMHCNAAWSGWLQPCNDGNRRPAADEGSRRVQPRCKEPGGEGLACLLPVLGRLCQQGGFAFGGCAYGCNPIQGCDIRARRFLPLRPGLCVRAQCNPSPRQSAGPSSAMRTPPEMIATPQLVRGPRPLAAHSLIAQTSS